MIYFFRELREDKLLITPMPPELIHKLVRTAKNKITIKLRERVEQGIRAHSANLVKWAQPRFQEIISFHVDVRDTSGVRLHKMLAYNVNRDTFGKWTSTTQAAIAFADHTIQTSYDLTTELPYLHVIAVKNGPTVEFCIKARAERWFDKLNGYQSKISNKPRGVYPHPIGALDSDDMAAHDAEQEQILSNWSATKTSVDPTAPLPVDPLVSTAKATVTSTATTGVGVANG